MYAFALFWQVEIQTKKLTEKIFTFYELMKE